MITPHDIKSKEFQKSFRGYNEIEVDRFLDDIINSYEKIYNENIELKDKIMVLNEKLTKYDNLEQTLKDTLIVAQTTSEDVIKSSKERADAIINTAEINSKRILELKTEQLENLKEVYDSMMKEACVFKNRYKALIESQRATLSDFEADLSKNFDTSKFSVIDTSKFKEEFDKKIDKEELKKIEDKKLTLLEDEKTLEVDNKEDNKEIEIDEENLEINLKANISSDENLDETREIQINSKEDLDTGKKVLAEE